MRAWSIAARVKSAMFQVQTVLQAADARPYATLTVSRGRKFRSVFVQREIVKAGECEQESWFVVGAAPFVRTNLQSLLVQFLSSVFF